MKKLLFIFFTLISIQSFAQTNDSVYIRVKNGIPGVYNLSKNAGGDSIVFYVSGVRYALPVGTVTDLSNYYNKTTVNDSLSKKLDTSYKQSLVGFNPIYFEQINKDSANVRLRMSTDTSFSDASDTSTVSSLAAKKYPMSKHYRDTATASKTFTSDVTVKRFMQENVHTYIDPSIPTATNATTYLTIPTYDGSGQTVHPDVWYNPNGWNGHKWWMAITPYYQQRQRFENPSLLYSDDGKTWNVPPGVTNPISPEPTDTTNSFQYDTEIIPPGYDNKLRVMYGRREVDTSSAFYTRTYDGSTIGPEVKAFDDFTEGIVSPAVVEKNGVYILYYVDVYNGYVIKKRTATNPEGPWSAPVVCTLTNNTGFLPWHLNANLIGDQVCLLLTVSQAGTSGSGAKLFFASSVNDSTFITGSTPVLSKKPGSWDNASIYRSCAIILDGGTKRLGLYYSASDTLLNWHTGYTEINLSPYLSTAGGTVNGNVLINGSLSVSPTGYTSFRAGRNFSLNSYPSTLGGGVGGNLYFDGTNWRYINAGKGSLLWSGSGGEMAVYIAPSGVASAIANINPAFTVFNTGGVGVGISAPDPGANNFTVQGVSKSTSYDVSTSTTPSPASGHAIFWFDGTSVKVTKNVGGTITTTTLF
jgi:hypothetical protein